MRREGADIAVRLDRIGIFSRGVERLRGLATLLGTERVLWRPTARQARDLDAIVGWGHKPTARRARDFAAAHSLPYVALEDGFLRSVRLGHEEPPLSIVVDDVGIYYDARSPSRLERLLAYEGPDDVLADAELLERAQRLRECIVDAELSKYNHAPAKLPERWHHDGRPTVLVVDQTFGDASVPQGLGGPATFEQMLAAARAEHPDARIIAKLHPDTLSGKKRGYLDGGALPGRIERLAEPVSPVALLQQADHVYVCSSQLGFEAVLLGKPVTCFGAPFYAGWGLTDDRVVLPRRGRQRTVDELAAAALLLYPRYLDPRTGERCEAERVVEHLALQRAMLRRNARDFHCLGFSTWKRPYVRRFLESPGHAVVFHRSWRQLRRSTPEADSVVLIWGRRHEAERVTTASGEALPVWHMEDGFLRSVRLGSELSPPGSLVVDEQGIYYDPSEPSELETLLQEAAFSDDELQRAAALRKQIVELAVSKYNAARQNAFTPCCETDRPVVLVPGQVVDDASVRLGSPEIRSDEALLRAVRQARPEAYVVYKPHPDVLSGNRAGKAPGPASGLCDEVVTDASLPACLAAVHEVHTMTSLVGFEALLRGLPVTTYGQPFYAGWGLTEDRLPVARRARRLTLDELVAGVLLRYPRYYSWQAHAFCTADQLVLELARAKQRSATWSFRTPWLVRRLRDVAILTHDWRHA